MPSIEELRAAIEAIELTSGSIQDEDPSAFSESYKETADAYDMSASPCNTSSENGSDSHASQDSEESRAFAKIARLVAQTERSSVDIRERLSRDDFSQDAIESALDHAIRCGFVDDNRYAEWLVRGRLRQGRGLSGIERELSRIGFSLEDVRGWPEDFEYQADDELERALSFIKAHPTNAKNKQGAAYRKLVSKGFSSSVSASAARIWCEQQS